MKKIFLPFLILFLLVCSVFAQTPQTITLKPGFNFVSFISSISLTPAQLKTQNPAVEDVYLFSAAAGSFLSANDGTLSTLAAGKGYIVKSSAISDTPLSISGDAIQTIGNINIKTGFNLIGFSKMPSTTSTFKSLMNVYTSIKGIYKWSPAAGSFIQVVRDNSGVVTLLDGADPSFKAGESYFFNFTEDTTINYDGTDIILGSGPPAPVAKTLEITGTVGAITTASPSYSVVRAIDLSTMQISVYDEINNASVEGAVVTATGADTFKATLPVATADRYLSVLVKSSDNKVIYKSFLGRIPKATEVTENTVKISNIKVSDESTARAIIVLENRAKIPMTAVIAKKSVDASISNTDFALVLEEHIAGLEDRVPELKPAVSLIANVLTTANVDATIKQKVTAMAFSDSTNLLKNYVSLMQDANTLKTVNNITAPTELVIGNYKVTAQSALGEIDDAVIGMNDTIGQRVEMPVLDPPPGQYNTPVLVEMTCATPSANIVYDYGDGNPGVTYTAPVFLTKTCTLNVAAFRSDWPMSWHSKFVNATYTIGSSSGGTTETRVLSSITLDRTSEAIVVTTEKYYLSNIKISAHYSNGDSKEVQATRWEMISCPGSFSDSDNSYYLWSKTGDAIFNAVYSENGIEKKIEFKLMVKTQVEFDKLNSIMLILSKTSDEISVNTVYDLSKIKALLSYSDGTTKEVMVNWSITSGSGTLSNLSYKSTTAETAILKASYYESGYLKTVEFVLKTVINILVQGVITINNKKALITSAGGSINLDNGAILEIPPQSLDGTAEISLSEVKHPYFTSPYSTTISISSTRQTKVILKIPLKDEQEINCLDICYIDCSNKIVFIDSNEVILHPNIQRAPDRFGPVAYYAIVYGILAAEVIYNWDTESTYYPKKTETPLISCPYYEQPGPTCWAAANLMLIKTYNPNADLNIYSLDYLVMSNSVTNGLDFSVATSAEINKLKEIYKKYISIDTKDDWNLVEPISKLHPYKLFNRVLSALDNNKPSIGYINDHAYVFLGYINKSSYEEIELIFHDPIFYYTDLPYHKMKIKDLRNRFKGFGSGFSSIPSTIINNSILQTINLWSNENASKYVDFEGLGFFKNGYTVDYVSYDRTKNDGYTFQNSEIPNFDQITVKVKCFNTSAKPVDCLIKTEIIKLNEKFEKISEPIIPKFSDSQSVPPILPGETNLNLDLKTLYKPFTIDILQNSFTDNINENDENFEICTSLYNVNNPTQRLDGFNIKFKYRKLFIKPSNGLKNPLPLESPITFVAMVGNETISNNKINWSITPVEDDATVAAGILSVTQNAAGKSFTIKGIVNDPQSIHNGKEAAFIATMKPNNEQSILRILPQSNLVFLSDIFKVQVFYGSENVTKIAKVSLNNDPFKMSYSDAIELLASQPGVNVINAKLPKGSILSGTQITEDIDCQMQINVKIKINASLSGWDPFYPESTNQTSEGQYQYSKHAAFSFNIENTSKYDLVDVSIKESGNVGSFEIIGNECLFTPPQNDQIFYEGVGLFDVFHFIIKSKYDSSDFKEVAVNVWKPYKEVIMYEENISNENVTVTYEYIKAGSGSTKKNIYYHGYYKKIYPDGKARITGEYFLGKKDGLWRGYYSAKKWASFPCAGKLCYEIQYQNGVRMDSTFKYYGTDGQLQERNISEMIEYNEEELL